MLTISEVKKNYTKKDFIVDNLMKSSGIYCLVARPKVGKSLFTDSGPLLFGPQTIRDPVQPFLQNVL